MVPLPEPVNLPPSSSLRPYVVDEHNAYPCRRCLQDGLVGETMYLISYNPFDPAAKSSPYQQAGPIFVHSHDCKPYSGSEIQSQQLRRLISVRAFDKEHMMKDATVLPGEGLAEKATEMLADATIEYLHVHNAKRGCFAVKIERE
jgi:Protein of unknown function (DUF1203)